MKKTIGGADVLHNDSFLLSQTQHILSDGDKLYASMMFQYGTRVINFEDGSFVQDFGGFDQHMKMAAGMCLLGADKILVCDLNNDAMKVFDKNDLAAAAQDFSGSDSFTKPNDVVWDGESNVYVAEVGDKHRFSCIDVLSQETKFEVAAAGDKEFTGVNCIAFDTVNKRVVVSDSDGNLVAVFSKDGDYLFSIDIEGPQGVAVDKDGNIFVCDQTNNRVQVFDKEGKFAAILGGGNVEFSYPWDVIVLPNGDIAVVDGSIFRGWNRVQVL